MHACARVCVCAHLILFSFQPIVSQAETTQINFFSVFLNQLTKSDTVCRQYLTSQQNDPDRSLNNIQHLKSTLASSPVDLLDELRLTASDLDDLRKLTTTLKTLLKVNDKKSTINKIMLCMSYNKFHMTSRCNS